MPTTWVPTAFWLTVKDGIPRRHSSRAEAIQFAVWNKVLAFRQDVATGRIDVIYEPIEETTYKVGQMPIAYAYSRR